MILLLLIVVLVIFNAMVYIEPYEDIAPYDTDLDKCAHFCKTITGCNGFSYDKYDKKCYVSRHNISGRPVEGLYKSKYKKSDLICNKIGAIKKLEDDRYKYTPNILKNNATYVCTDIEKDDSQIYIHDEGFNKIKDISEMNNLTIKPYKVQYFKWRLNTYKDNEIDEIIKKRRLEYEINQGSNEINQESNELNQESNELNQEIVSHEMSGLKVKLNKKTMLDSILEHKSISNAVDTIKKHTDIVDKYFDKTISKTKDIVHKLQENKYVTYKPYNKFNNGLYLKPHKCVQNISLNNCLLYCTKNDKCKGVEWNPYYIKYKNNKAKYFYRNICCPKTSEDFIERNGEYDLGKYYSKRSNYILPKKPYYIIN